LLVLGINQSLYKSTFVVFKTVRSLPQMPEKVNWQKYFGPVLYLLKHRIPDSCICHTERSRSVANAIIAKSTFDKGFDCAQPDNSHKC